MKRTLCLILCIAILLGITGCNNTTDISTHPTTSSSTTVQDTTHSSSDREPLPTSPTEPSEFPTPVTCEHEFKTVARKDSTCTQKGYVDYVCKLCGLAKAQDLAATGHKFMDATCAVPKTCSVCGTTEGKELGHHYPAGQSTCSRCGTTPPAPNCEHSYQLSNKVDATCTENGSVTYTCSKCSYHYSAPYPAKGHSFLDATCLAAPNCKVCGVTSGDPLGHKFGEDHLCSRCGVEDPNKPEQKPDEPLDPDELPPLGFFTITVRNKSGKTIADVMVTVFVDNSPTAAGSARTDANGKASIPVSIGDSYKVVLSLIPPGYGAKESYTFRSLNANITLTTTPVLNPNDHSNGQYKVGSTMADFTLTDTNGNSYTLSELLKSKNVVILNFWFVSCTPCKNEFPYFEEFYPQYSDDVQLLALSHFDSESAIRQLQKDMGLTFPMVRENIGMQKGFNLSSYPTTVVIGQGMKILKIHTGSYDREEVQALFESYAG